MQKLIRYLGVLLVAQLLLAVAMSYTGPTLATRSPNTPLLDLAGHSVDRIVIDAPEQKSLVLAHKGAGWVLPDTGNFPADGNQVDTFLSRLEGLKHGLAVATSSDAFQRFKVGDKDFERRVQLQQGDKTVATLYFGTSPGLRQIHARGADDKAVYTTDFAAYEIPDHAANWEDKSALHIPRDKIAAVTLPGLVLQRVPNPVQVPPAPAKSKTAASASGGTTPAAAPAPAAGKPPAATAAKTATPATTAGTHWEIAGLASGDSVNQAMANTLVGKLADLDFGAVLGTASKKEYGLDKPLLTITLRQDGGKTVEYRLNKFNGDYVLKSSQRPEYFRVMSAIGDALVKDAARDSLVQTATAKKDSAAAGQDRKKSPDTQEHKS